jgi:hypothetical protein
MLTSNLLLTEVEAYDEAEDRSPGGWSALRALEKLGGCGVDAWLEWQLGMSNKFRASDGATFLMQEARAIRFLHMS